MSNVRYVQYVSGKSITLHRPIKSGEEVFEAGITYRIENYSDFMRLTSTGDFVQVNEDGSPYTPPVVQVVAEEPVVEPVPVVDETPRRGGRKSSVTDSEGAE